MTRSSITCENDAAVAMHDAIMASFMSSADLSHTLPAGLGLALATEAAPVRRRFRCSGAAPAFALCLTIM
eukprot:COSAG02_NODE_3410_length_6788_cov_20.669009_4_plen_70_part_00